MKILQYCQHVLGIGHYFRTLELCRAFRNHQVALVTGGAEIDVPLPQHVRELQLPSLIMDTEFKGLLSGHGGNPVQQIKRKRRQALFSLYKAEAPDLFLIELYPFGRRAFSFEIDPVLKGIRHGILKSSRVVCSLRDILVDRKKYTSAYESKVVNTLNRYFDALLIHADPALLALDETFRPVADIRIPIVYTGFVTPHPAGDARAGLRQKLGIKETNVLIVASLGGGRVGAPLLESVIKAFQSMELRHNGHLHVFTGPLMSKENFTRLSNYADNRIYVERFSSEFLSYLSAADLSVSMAGYNTCMNILAAGVAALVWPFSQNREQRLRAERLAAAGGLKVLSEADLNPDRLAAVMAQALFQRPRLSQPVDLNGAMKTARWIEEWMGSGVSTSKQ